MPPTEDLPEKLEKLYSMALELVLPEAMKAAAPAFMSFAAPAGDEAAPPSNKKDEFSQQFTEAFRATFLALLARRAEDKKPLSKKKLTKEEMDERISQMSLLSTDAMDAQIATEMQTRVLQTQFQMPLSFLSMRLEKVVGHPFLLNENPLHPQKIALHFKTCVDKANDNRKITSIATQSWLKALKELYPVWLETLNQSLIRQLILPDIDESDVNSRYQNSLEAQRTKAKEIRQTVIGEITGKSAEGAAAVLPQELMASLAALIKQAGAVNPEMQPHIFTGSQKGPAIDSEDVVKTLRDMKQEVRVNAETGYREQVSNQTLADMIKTSTNLGSFALNEQTQNAIALMSMMFAKMNQEESLAGPMKPLLADLQMPVLKKALRDEKFFMDTENPAQQLVNEIAKAGSQWTPSSNANRDIFYKKMVSIVDDVKEKHEEDEDVFDKNLQELNDFLEKEERRTGKVEERIIEMEQADARAEAAHSRARGAITVRIHNRPVPHITRDFIDNHWEKILFYYINKNEAERSDEYNDSLTCLESLIDASIDKITDLKALIVSMNRHMEAQGYEKNERQGALQNLANELKVVQFRVRKAQEEGETIAPEAVVTHGAAETEKTPDVEAPPAHIDDEFDKKAAECATNSWFHLVRPPANAKIKVKLAAIIKSNSNYVFVSREGLKILTIPREEVASKLRDGTLSIIEASQIFDRALESVIKSIRAG